MNACLSLPRCMSSRPCFRTHLIRTSLGLAACLGTAQGQDLVKDINQSSIPLLEVGSAPSDYVQLGSRLYFSAFNPDTGRELYYLDGANSQPQLLGDLAPGPEDGLGSHLTELGSGDFVFAGFDGLYVSDGTAAGTFLIAPGLSASSLTAHQGDVFFMGSEAGVFGPNLWRTDGTVSGTIQIETIGLTGSHSSANQVVASAGANLFFTTLQSTPGGGLGTLALTDGSIGGAVTLVTVQEESVFLERFLTPVGNRVVWRAAEAGFGSELWVSDGTQAGTGMVELMPGASSSNPTDFTVVGNEVYFVASHPTLGREIYRTDGTSGGTVVVTDTDTFGPNELWDAGGQLFFRDSGPLGAELWTTTGAFGSEFLFADFAPGSASGFPTNVVNFGAGILCQAENGASGKELFYSEGTPATTFVVADIVSGAESSMPSGLTPYGGRVFFSASNVFVPEFSVVTNEELWSTDGTAAGTQLAAEIAPAFGLGSSPREYVSLGDRVVFSALSGFGLRSLWVSDGTLLGTTAVSDPAQPLPLTESDLLFDFSGQAVFAGTDPANGRELWRTDGTSGGTELIADLFPGPSSSDPVPLLVWESELYFVAEGLGVGRELYATDGTAAGTRRVADINPGPGDSGPSALTVHDGQLYFFANQGSTGRELWRTDGTSSGTELVVDLVAGPDDGVKGDDLASFGGLLYFTGRDTAIGFDYDLWRTDGTPVGTSLFYTAGPSNDLDPRVVQQVNGRLIFGARLNGAFEYLGTDGVAVEQLTFPPHDAFSGAPLISNGSVAIGILRLSGGGLELFATDGTAVGTSVLQLLTNDDPFLSRFQGAQVTTGANILFEWGTNDVGRRLLVSDGTSAGTSELATLVPLSLASGPGGLDISAKTWQRVGNSLLYTAATFDMGPELYSLPLEPLGDWVAEPFGEACAGSSGQVPALGTSGAAAIGETLILEVTEAAPNSVASIFFSPTFSFAQVGTCSSYLANPLFLANIGTDAGGSGALAFTIGNDPALVGLRLWLQALIADAGGGLFGFASLTSALETILGD